MPAKRRPSRRRHPRLSPIPSNEFAEYSTDLRGYKVHWTWRCEYCGRLSYIDCRAIARDRPRIWQRKACPNPHTQCDHCSGMARWNHIASEMQLNRALRPLSTAGDPGLQSRTPSLESRGEIAHRSQRMDEILKYFGTLPKLEFMRGGHSSAGTRMFSARDQDLR